MSSAEPVVITVRFSSGTYTARAKSEKTTASSTISAEHAASALLIKLRIDRTDMSLSVTGGDAPNQHVQFTLKPVKQEVING